MTLLQLESLTEDELGILFHSVNVISPMTIPKMEFDMNTIKWIRHEMLINKLLASAPALKPESHPIFISLMHKLGVKVEIKPVPQPTIESCQPQTNTTSSCEPSTSTETGSLSS